MTLSALRQGGQGSGQRGGKRALAAALAQLERDPEDKAAQALIPLAAKLSAVASLFLWSAVISCGRLLAYL